MDYVSLLTDAFYYSLFTCIVSFQLLLGMIVLCLCIFILLQLVGCQDIITTIAGTGSGSYSGDSSQATSAALKFPMGLALDSSGILLILFA